MTKACQISKQDLSLIQKDTQNQIIISKQETKKQQPQTSRKCFQKFPKYELS